MTAGQSRFYVSAGGIKLHFLAYGTAGPAVLLLPGITSPAIQWGFVAERLAEFAHVYVLDNRGRGLSDQRPGLGHRLDDYAADAAAVVRDLELDTPVILGHSMGGRIGIRLAARYPEAVGRLILADPPVSGPGRRPYPSALQPYLDRIAAASRGEEPPAAARFTPETPAQTRLRKEWLPTCNPEAVTESHRSFGEEDIFADLGSIRCPTLLLYAEHGGTITDAEAAELVHGLADGTSVKLAGVGHMMPWFDLESFVASVRAFVVR